jgi:PhnB protein
MASRLNPYISFRSDAREAMEFYRDVLGGELSMNTFGEFGMEGEGSEQIMHAQLETPAGFTLMASDTPPGMEHSPGGAVTISLSGDDRDDLRRYWTGLAEGGTVTMPLEPQAWGDEFGMLTDRYGVAWMVNVAGQHD